MVKAECEASNSPRAPEFKITRHFPNTVNDESMMKALGSAFTDHFGDKFNPDIPTTTTSEDFSVLATSQGKPSVFWHWGGIEEKLWDQSEKEGRLHELPANHSVRFAPVLQPTMKTGIDAFCVAALTFLDGKTETSV